jgi:hypothetical protein
MYLTPPDGVPTSVYDKLFETICVSDNLSKSDKALILANSTSDAHGARVTAAWKKALATGRTWVFGPEGTSPINDRLPCNDNQTIIASGKSTLRPVAGSTANPLLFEVNAKTRVRFLNITFDGNRPNLTNFNNLCTNYQATDVVYDGCYWFNTRGIACIFSGCNLSGVINYRTNDCGTLSRSTLVSSDRKQAIAFTSGGTRNFVKNGDHNATGLDSVSVTGQTDFECIGIKVRDGDAGSLYFANNVGLTLDDLDVSNGATGGNGVDVIDCSDIVLGVVRTHGCGAAGVLLAGAIKGAAIGVLHSKNNWQSKGGASPSVHRGGLTFALLPDKVIEDVSLGAGCVIYDDQGGASVTQRHPIGIYKQTPVGGEVSGTFKNIRISAEAVLTGYDGSGVVDDLSVFQTVDLGAVGFPRVMNIADAATFTICPDTQRGQVSVVQINNGYCAALALFPGGTPAELYDPSAKWVNTDTGTDQALYRDAGDGMIKLKNKTGTTKAYVIRMDFQTVR